MIHRNVGITVIRQLLLSLCASLVCTASALGYQSVGTELPAVSVANGNVLFAWQGVNWAIPQELLLYFPVSITKTGELLVDAGYTLTDRRFASTHQSHDLELSIRIRPDDSEDPKRGFSTMQRTGAHFIRDPALQSLKLQGMKYLGSQSNLHFFQLVDQGAYVECNLNVAEAKYSPKFGTNVGDKMFYCNTALALPSGLFAWIRSPNIRLNDIATVFRAAHKEILSYMH
jgi:hypothetical protein